MLYPTLIAISCMTARAFVGASRNATLTGAILGALGPMGVVAVAFYDQRDQCYGCGGRLNGEYPICPHCHSKLEWIQGHAFSTEMVEEARRKQAA